MSLGYDRPGQGQKLPSEFPANSVHSEHQLISSDCASVTKVNSKLLEPFSKPIYTILGGLISHAELKS